MTINKEQAVSDATCRHLMHLPSGKCLGCGEQHQPLSDYQPGDDEAFMREHLAEAASHPLEQQQAVSGDEMRPCPFCGCKVVRQFHPFERRGYVVDCNNCNGGFHEMNEELARKRWNARTALQEEGVERRAY